MINIENKNLIEAIHDAEWVGVYIDYLAKVIHADKSEILEEIIKTRHVVEWNKGQYSNCVMITGSNRNG